MTEPDRPRPRKWAGAVAAVAAAGGVAVFAVVALRPQTHTRSQHAAGGHSRPVAATGSGSPSPSSHVTGAYRAALTGPGAAAARAHHVVQTFQQLAAGIGEIDATGTHAKVLVFGEQTRTDDRHDGARTSTITLTATIERSGNTYLISGVDTSGTNAGLPPGSPDLTFAAEAGRAEVVNMLSYRRTGFAADLQRALDGAIDPLRSQIARTAPDTKAALTAGRYDLSGTVTGVAIQSAQGTRVALLVAATGYQVARDGTRTPETDGRYEVSVVRAGGRWVTSGVAPIEAS